MSDSTPTSLHTPLLTFLALYLTTLFSLDTWAAARTSPFRVPSTTSTFRPASTPPAPGSYQAGMHGRGNVGPRDEEGGRSRRLGEVGRVDSRPPLRMGEVRGVGRVLRREGMGGAEG